MAHGVALTFTLSKTGAMYRRDAAGKVAGVVPAVYLIGEDHGAYTVEEVQATKVGGTIRAQLALPGRFTVGQKLRLKAWADDPGDTTYDPPSAFTTATVSKCAVAPRAWFEARSNASVKHQVDLNAEGSLGRGLRYTWAVKSGQRWTAIGSGIKVTHTFPAAGKVVVRLTIRDSSGRTSSVQKSVRVD